MIILKTALISVLETLLRQGGAKNLSDEEIERCLSTNCVIPTIFDHAKDLRDSGELTLMPLNVEAPPSANLNLGHTLILVPKIGTADYGIAQGSGVVAKIWTNVTSDLTLVNVHYEGNLYGASNLVDYDSRVIVAANRLRSNAPTIARLMLRLEEVDENFDTVGFVHGLDTIEIDATNPKVVNWCSTPAAIAA